MLGGNLVGDEHEGLGALGLCQSHWLLWQMDCLMLAEKLCTAKSLLLFASPCFCVKALKSLITPCHSLA
jgi:hypothetical protein